MIGSLSTAVGAQREVERGMTQIAPAMILTDALSTLDVKHDDRQGTPHAKRDQISPLIGGLLGCSIRGLVSPDQARPNSKRRAPHNTSIIDGSAGVCLG